MPLQVPPLGPVPVAGAYVQTVSPAATGTSSALGNGTLRLAPWVVTRTIGIDRLGADVATVGEAGSKFRIGIYADNGNLYPGTLVVDAGQIAGDSATVQELTVAVTLSPGVYWIGGVSQSAPTTQPTMRVTSTWQPPVLVSAGTSTPSAAATQVGYSQTGVTGALPSTFTSTVASVLATARVFARIA